MCFKKYCNCCEKIRDYKTEKQEFIIKFPLLLISAKIWEKLHRITNELVIFKKWHNGNKVQGKCRTAKIDQQNS